MKQWNFDIGVGWQLGRRRQRGKNRSGARYWGRAILPRARV